MSPKPVYTTGEVARILQVAPRTVANLFDSGQLPGWRIGASAPASPGAAPRGDRRVPHASLVAYMRATGRLTEALDLRLHVLLAGPARGPFAGLVASLGALLPGDRYLLERAGSGFEAGVAVARKAPRVVVLDFAFGRGECVGIAQRLRPCCPEVLLIGLTSEDENDPAELLAAGFDELFVKPFDVALLAERLARMPEAGEATP